MWRWWARRLWFTLRFTVCFAERGAGAQEKLFWGALCCMRHELNEGGSLQTSMWYDRSMAASQQDLHARPQVTKCTPCADVESSRGTRFVGEGWGSGRRLGHWPRFCGECVVLKVMSLSPAVSGRMLVSCAWGLGAGFQHCPSLSFLLIEKSQYLLSPSTSAAPCF